jgi:hypothetical protein
MTTPTPPTPGGPAPDDARVATGSGEPITTLRGAGVDVDIRRVGRAVVGVCLVALAVVAVVLLVAGFRKNAQVNDLRHHGVPVSVTVTRCYGLMGGSGSNLVGYSCSGSFTLDGRRYVDAIPGDALHRTGTTVRGVTVPGDPGLLSTAGALATEHASWTVFIVPVILLVVLAGLVSVVILRRSRRRKSPQPLPSSGLAPSEPV